MQDQMFLAAMNGVLPYGNICFGNETEASTFSDALNYNTKDFAEIDFNVVQSKEKSSSPHIVVLTHCTQPTILVTPILNNKNTLEMKPLSQSQSQSW